MKYNVNVNQIAIIKSGLKIDFIDAGIFDMLVVFAHSGKCKNISYEGKIYYLFSWTLIKDQLPLMGIKTRQGSNKRYDKLVDAGLIHRHEKNKQNRKPYYSFGVNYEKLLFQNDDNNGLQHCKRELPLTDNNGLQDNTTINNSTIIKEPSFLIKHLKEKHNRKFKTLDERKLKARLKNYSQDEILKAVDNCYSSDFAKSQNFGFCTPEYFTRNDANIEKWLHFEQVKKKSEQGEPIFKMR